MTASSTPLKIGTRGSDLALTQAHAIAADLLKLGRQSEITIIKTSGDKDQQRPFAQVGAPGLFVRELERALSEGRVDLAVHCYKDLPSDSPADLLVVACPAREDARDRLLLRADREVSVDGLFPLAQAARVGTASARRTALIADLRSDIECVHLRGNVPTRVSKLRGDDYDAIVLASAGLNRLDLAAQRGECKAMDRSDFVELELDPRIFVPAPSQGALALQVRVSDESSRALVAQLDDAQAHRAVRAERKLLALVEAGCQVAFGAIAFTLPNGDLELVAALEVDGVLRRAEAEGSDPEQLAGRVHALLLPERLQR